MVASALDSFVLVSCDFFRSSDRSLISEMMPLELRFFLSICLK